MDTERRAFEEWFEIKMLPGEGDYFRLDGDGDYALSFVDWAWEGWKARSEYTP